MEYKGSISFRIVSDRKLHKRAGRRKSSAVGNGEVGGVLVFVFLFDVFVFLFFVFVLYVRDLHLQRETTLRTVAGTSGFKSWPKEDSGRKGENDCKREEREQERTDWWESLRGGTHHQSSHHGTTETGSGECFSETGHRSGFKLFIIDHFSLLQAIEESPRPINKKAVLRDLETILAQEIHLGYLVKVGARQKKLGN